MKKLIAWLRRLFAAYKPPTTPEPPAVPPVELPTPEPPKPPTTPSTLVWGSVAAPQFFRHGYDGEDGYRVACLQAALANGCNCLTVDATEAPNDELGMHLLKLEHPQKPGYFLGESWYCRAKAYGVTRWQLDVTGANAETRARWKWLTKAYMTDELQFIDGGKVATL